MALPTVRTLRVYHNFRTDGELDFVTSPIFDEESFFSDEGFDDFLGEIEEVGNRPWEIASFEKKLRVVFLMIMIIIGPEISTTSGPECETRS